MIELLALMGCDNVEQGTVVGNPGDTMTVVAEGKGVSYEDTTGFAVAWQMTDCDGVVTEEPMNDAIDLAGEVLEMPGGTWCSVGLELIELELEGIGGDEATFTIELEGGLVELESAAGLIVDGGDYYFELGYEDWIDAEALGLRPGQDVDVGADHEAYEELQDALLQGSAIFVDADGDRALHPDERDAGAAAVGSLRRDRALDTGEGDSDSRSEGCSTLPAVGGLPLVLLLLRRRRAD